MDNKSETDKIDEPTSMTETDEIEQQTSITHTDKIEPDENILKIILDLKAKWCDKKIKLNTINILLKETMEIVDKLNCSGKDKKVYVKTIIRQVIIDLIEDPDEERLVLEIIDKNVLENTMDIIISATRGEFDIKNKKTQKKMCSLLQTVIPIIINLISQVPKKTNIKIRRKNKKMDNVTLENLDKI